MIPLTEDELARKARRERRELLRTPKEEVVTIWIAEVSHLIRMSGLFDIRETKMDEPKAWAVREIIEARFGEKIRNRVY